MKGTALEFVEMLKENHEKISYVLGTFLSGALRLIRMGLVLEN
jgi:hypothetical protein